MRWCLKLIKQTESTAILQQSFVFQEAITAPSWCRSLKVKERVTLTAPWETRLVLVGQGRGILCWSRYARWLDAADRGSEAGRWWEDRPERAETRGRVPCCRRAGSTWFLQDSAPLDAFQSPAKSRANTHDGELSLELLFSVKTVDKTSRSYRVCACSCGCCPKALPSNFSTFRWIKCCFSVDQTPKQHQPTL